MLVREVMTRKVYTVSATESFSNIVKLLVKRKISGVPVVNKKGKVIGIISEKDLFFKLFPSQKKFYKDIKFYMNFENIENDAQAIKKLKAKDFMSKEVISVSPDDHILKACSLSGLHNIRRLPVIEKGKLVGIVTTNNIYKNFLASFISK